VSAPPETSRVRVAIEIALFVAVVVADAYGLVPITQTIFLLPLVWILLRLGGEGGASIGLRRPERPGRAIAVGVVAGVLMELLAVYITTPLISGYFGVEPDYSQLSEIRGNLLLLIIFLALSWTLAAFGEEICFRGFLMKRVAQLLGDGHAAWIAALVLSSVLFGWGHTEQGVSGWIQEGLSGLLLGILFLATKRNLAVPIVAHGISNTLAFVLIYLGRYPGLG
jgi:membrane protease YdiL (CAAX protease family)